jgi:hypothetical protein
MIIFFIETFNNREIAIIIWLIILLFLAMINKEFRISLLTLVKVFFVKAILRIYFLMTLYVFLIILGLYHFGFWSNYFLKETIFWYFGIAFISIYKVYKISEDKDYFKKLFVDYIKLTAILGFITSLYSFSLIIELFLVPLFLLIAMMSAVSQTKKEYQGINKLFNNILVIGGYFSIIYTIIKIITDFNSFANGNNLTSFILPLIFTSLYIPFIYCFALYTSYETLFLRLKYFIKTDKAIKKAKWEIFTSFHVKFRKLNSFAKEFAMIIEEMDCDMITVIKIFNNNSEQKA